MLSKALTTAAAGNAGGGGLGIEDVFSTWLYTGNGSTQTITNGIDLAGEGGLVWLKKRSAIASPFLFDTARGAEKYLQTNYAGGESTANTTLSAFNSDGFTLKTEGDVNGSGATFASWTFRKAPGFFDVVTYTGNGTLLTLNHNLGSVPGCIIVKRTDSIGNWPVYHRSLSADATVYLNTTGGTVTRIEEFGSVTSTTFQVGDSGGGSSQTNASGGTYVAYLFAHDEQIFGEGGDQSVIKCGSFTAPGSGTATVALGWEPQFVLIKRSDSTGDWQIIDNMRGATADRTSTYLRPNLSNAELTASNYLGFDAQGFSTSSSGFVSGTYIYIAIRRGPMKTPISGSEVFDVTSFTGNSNANTITSNVDMRGGGGRLYWSKIIGGSNTGTGYCIMDDLRGDSVYLNSATTAGDSSPANSDWGVQNFIKHNNWFYNSSSSTYIAWMFRRAPGFFDMVAYTGTGVARTVAHNLGVAPELMIIKTRTVADQWTVYSKATWDAGVNNFRLLQLQSAFGANTNISLLNSTQPTSTVFSVGTSAPVNGSGDTHIAYLFATLPGISKVGSYTGTGTTLDIDCGFTSGARFVLIKRTDSTGDWYVWDTARGIVSGNDPYLLLNSSTGEVTNTDYIDPLSSGFQISSTAPAAINASGGSYIFLAIA